MAPSQSLFFGPYRLDRKSGTLWRDEQPIALRPQTFALLQYLAEHPGEVVSPDKFREHVWQNLPITEATFRVSIHELRQALQDHSTPPQYIETVRSQGYRFCALVTVPQGTGPQLDSVLVGRTHELLQLQDCLALAQRGERQLVFVSGQAGMGKTTLVEAFLNALAEDQELCIGRGSCIEHTGPVEAYLPVLDALGSLGRSPFGNKLVQVLQRVAPTWLLQLPMLMPQSESHNLYLDVPASTRVRMIRELVEALRVVSAEHLVILVFEDLHWSDPSTVDLLRAIIQRAEPARLLIVSTYRPLELQVQNHPLLGLLQESRGHRKGQEVDLTPFNADAIHMFLGQRLEGAVGSDLTALLH